MTAQERVAQIVSRDGIAHIRVVHPDKGEIILPAFSAFDAALQALAIWQLDFAEKDRMRAYLAAELPPQT